jgi:hypothetical protein
MKWMNSLKSTCEGLVLGMAESKVYFEDNTLKVIDNTENAVEKVLLECAAELVSQTARNTRVDTGQLKGSWASHVDKTATGYEAVIGSPLENAIWEEFGTGEQAINGNGRKGWPGKSASRAFWKAFTSEKNKLINKIQNSLKGL